MWTIATKWCVLKYLSWGLMGKSFAAISSSRYVTLHLPLGSFMVIVSINFLHMMVWWTCIGQFLRLNEGMNKHERFSSHVSHQQWDKLPTSHVQLVIYMLLNIYLAGLLCHSTKYVSGFINVILAIVRTRRALLFLVVVLTLCSHMSCTRKFVPIEHYFPG